MPSSPSQKKRRAGALILKLRGQPKMLLMQRAGSGIGLEGNKTAGGIGRGRHWDAGNVEFKEFHGFPRIRRHGRSMAGFIPRFRLAFDK